MARAFLGDMIAQRYGHIVGVSSMISYWAMGVSVSYTTSKYAARGFMDALNRKSRHENWGVKTLLVLPHLTNTRKELIDFLRQKIPYAWSFFHFSKDFRHSFVFIFIEQRHWNESNSEHQLRSAKTLSTLYAMALA